MAHMINENRMMYVGTKPWHDQGIMLEKAATSEEAIKAARLDYQINLVPIQTKDGVNIKGRCATVRADNNTPLGVVSDRYEIVQNTKAFDFFDSVVGSGEAIYHTAGALGLGERIWILAKLPKAIIKRDDVIEKYLLLTNSHDGKSSLRMFFTPIRVVCNNTLTLSLRQGDGEGISIRHFGDIRNKVEEAQRVLGITKLFYDNFEQVVEQLMGYQMNTARLDTYLKGVLRAGEDVSTRKENMLRDMVDLFEKGKGNDNKQIRHSAWAAFNAVTEFVDHRMTTKKTSKHGRLGNILFHRGARIKRQAYNSIVQLMNN